MLRLKENVSHHDYVYDYNVCVWKGGGHFEGHLEVVVLEASP